MNGRSPARQRAIDFMEHNDVLTELEGEKWFCVEDAITELLETKENNISLPRTYAEIEYTSEQLETDPIAIEGAKFDDLNYQHYMER